MNPRSTKSRYLRRTREKEREREGGSFQLFESDVAFEYFVRKRSILCISHLCPLSSRDGLTRRDFLSFFLSVTNVTFYYELRDKQNTGYLKLPENKQRHPPSSIASLEVGADERDAHSGVTGRRRINSIISTSKLPILNPSSLNRSLFLPFSFSPLFLSLSFIFFSFLLSSRFSLLFTSFPSLTSLTPSTLSVVSSDAILDRMDDSFGIDNRRRYETNGTVGFVIPLADFLGPFLEEIYYYATINLLSVVLSRERT